MSDGTTRPEPFEEPPDRLVLDLNPRRLRRVIFAFLSVAIAALWLLDYHVNYSRGIDLSPIRRLFNATREDGLASWFMVTLTLAVAFVLWLIVLTVHRLGSSRWQTGGWCFLALLFSYMAMDDGALIHERAGSSWEILSERAAEAAGPGADGGILASFPSYPWQLLFVPIFALAGLFMAVFLWRELEDRKARLLVLCALGLFAFSVGLDFMEGLREDHAWNIPARIARSVEGLESMTEERFGKTAHESLRHFSKTTEECLEMFGMTILFLTFLRRWTSLVPHWELRFAPERREGVEAAAPAEATARVEP